MTGDRESDNTMQSPTADLSHKARLATQAFLLLSILFLLLVLAFAAWGIELEGMQQELNQAVQKLTPPPPLYSRYQIYDGESCLGVITIPSAYLDCHEEGWPLWARGGERGVTWVNDEKVDVWRYPGQEVWVWTGEKQVGWKPPQIEVKGLKELKETEQ